MLSNMVTSLFEKERITTTTAKAKEARRVAERLITRAKKGHAAHREIQTLIDAGKTEEAKQMQSVALAHWRRAGRIVRKRRILKKLFVELAPQYMERNGGYTRILRTGYRLGDNAENVLLELVGTEAKGKPKKRKARAEKAKGKEKDRGAAAKRKPERREEAAADVEEAASAAESKEPDARASDEMADASSERPAPQEKQASGDAAEGEKPESS